MNLTVMRPGKFLLPLAFLLLSVAAQAGVRPSFSADYSAWNAEEIVLAQTTPQDGTFSVLESWKGDLRPGDVISVPELRPAADAKPITSYPEEWGAIVSSDDSARIPRQLVGSRIVLFLRRASDSKTLDREHQWRSSDLMGDMKASAVWIERQQLYCFQQLLNPGASKLNPCRINNAGYGDAFSEAALRARVDELIELRSDFVDAMQLSDGGEKAVRLQRFILSDVLPARLSSLDELGKCGASAVPVIREMVKDPAYGAWKDDLLKALAQAGGKSVGPDLTQILEQELAYWRRVGPTLQKGWWNLDTTPKAPLRLHYSDTFAAVVALERIQYRGANESATRLRNLWRSLPQLNDDSGLAELALECDKLIGSVEPKEH